MAMTAKVKDELSRHVVTKPCCRKAEVAAMLRFAGGLHIIGGRIVVERRNVLKEGRQIVEDLRVQLDVRIALFGAVNRVVVVAFSHVSPVSRRCGKSTFA